MSAPYPNIATSLQTLSDAVKKTFTLINRLSKLGDPQPDSSLNNQVDFDADREEFSSEIQSRLNQHEDNLELIKLDIDSFTGGTSHSNQQRTSERLKENARIAAQVTRLEEDLKHARSEFRKAVIAAKQASTQHAHQARAAYLTSLRNAPAPSSSSPQSPSSPTPSHSNNLFAARRPTKNPQPTTQSDLLVTASSDITAALRSTHAQLQSSLSRARFAQETLDASSAALADLGSRYDSLDELLQASKSLVSTLLKSQKSDSWYLETSFWLLVATIAWLVFRRWLYGPLWWLLWVPLKLALRVVVGVFGAAGIAGGQQAGTSGAVRAPLKVQPSAIGEAPRYEMAHDAPRPSIGAGAGGMGAKQGVSTQWKEPESMIEQKVEIDSSSDHDKPRHTDGTILAEPDRPRNTKKRMWEEPVEAAQREAARDEL
ncbi:MAG: hypothetical protein M1821_007902 [Bathelium mastoideum]|nr:MAG: hypothetical protein M1821_007902 [Bathelium mastoideum]